jgi:hypothetical protein|tara:strand:- start:2854 stop:3243 length:390 start_codon:yes stop_codon:yes gene_type:complete
MKNLLGILLMSILLTGCYASSLTYVGPATGFVQGKSSQALINQGISHVVKRETGKSPVEHLLTKDQISTIEEKKKQLNPCEQNQKLCSTLQDRIEKIQSELFVKKIKSRVERMHQKLLKSKTNIQNNYN